MTVNIDYGLAQRGAAISGWVDAKKREADATAKAAADREKRGRQQRKGLMTAALHGAAAVATGGASIPYSMKYGSMANKALMGDDYEGSTMQSAQGLGSMVYAGAQQEKQKGLARMEAAHNGQLESIYKAINALPPGQTMERARLSNQAANLTTQFHKRFKATEAEPVWKYASSERDRLQAKTLGSVADEGQRAYEAEYGSQGRLALGPDSGKVEAASGKQVVSPDSVQSAVAPESTGYDDLQKELWKARQNEINQSKISIGHDLADMSDEEEANNPLKTQGNTGFLDRQGNADIARFPRRRAGEKDDQWPRRWGTGWGRN